MNEEQERSTEDRVGAYLSVMVKTDSSDLFMHTGAKPTIKGGYGFKTLDEKLKSGETEVILRSMLSDNKMAEFEESGDIDYSFSISGVGRFRGNAFRQRGDVSIVMRHVIADIPTIDGLGLPVILKSLVEQKYGMVVVSGSTGSGKSTTLAAMIDYRNTHQAGHLITLEDPIEFIHRHKKSLVAQREIGTDTISFESGMRAAMREAPNVILMGEVRDFVTMEYAVKFANTGHLCLSTIHANTAVSSLERMLGFFHSDVQDQEAKRIAQNLRAIICQRLVPKIGGGKVAAIEILVNTTRMTDLIAARDYLAIKDAIDKGKNYGMQTFDQALCQLYEDGVIDETNAIEHSDSKTRVSQFIRFESTRSKGVAESNDLKLEDINDDSPTWGGGDTF
ncbi:MAG: PilT/PilU family type 4a pilus ATPase [Porticoccus sp.]